MLWWLLAVAGVGAYLIWSLLRTRPPEVTVEDRDVNPFDVVTAQPLSVECCERWLSTLKNMRATPRAILEAERMLDRARMRAEDERG